MAVLAACAVIGLGAWGLASELLHPAPSAALEPERAAAITHDLRPEPLPPAPPAEARAHLHVESTPVGARVSIDGESIGITPLDHDIEKSSTPRTITVELEGFAPFTDQLTPEVDQRLLVRLMDERPRRARPRFYAFD